MTTRIRIIVLVVAFLCLLVIGGQVRRRQIRAQYLVLWTSLVLLTVPLVLFPGAVDRVSEWLGIFYPPATLFLGAVVVLFLVSMHFSREISRLEERTRILAEELALSRLERDAGAPVHGEPLGTPAATAAAERRPELTSTGASRR